MITFKLSADKLKEADLKNFEKKYNVKLPNEMKDLYLKNNGGIPSHGYHNEYEIQAFNFITHGSKEKTIENEIEVLQKFERLPVKYIPFAYDAGGWHFCVDTNDANYGVIYVLPNGLGDNSPQFVASSFKDLHDNLSTEDDY